MFEKEAVDKITQQFGTSGEYNTRTRIWQYGAEFGYNKGYHDAEEHYMNVIDSQHKLVEESKANEWHDLRKDPNDLPKENMKQVMIITNYNECLMGWYCIHKKTWYSNDCPDPDDYIETKGVMEIKIIKWKEIVFPKE